MSAGLFGPVLCLLLWLLEDDCFLDLLLELFCRDEERLFFFLGLTAEKLLGDQHSKTKCKQIWIYNHVLSEWKFLLSNGGLVIESDVK